MKNKEKIPAHIISSCINVCAICINSDSSWVTLYGCYGDMLTGEFEPITIEMEFSSFNDLLMAEEHNNTDFVISKLAKEISEPSGEVTVIDLIGPDELSFFEHLFYFILILNEEEDLDTLTEENASYAMVSFLPREDYIECIFESELPVEPNEKLDYYNRILAVRYHFYRHHLKTFKHSKAVEVFGLKDPLIFSLAETQYKMLINRDGS